MTDANGWEILTALATVTTAAAAIFIAIRSAREAAARRRTVRVASLDAIDAALIALERDGPAVIDSAKRTQPQVVGFRLETESATAHLQDLQREAVVTGDEYEAIAYVLRQAGDANRAMDAVHEHGLSSAEGVRQLMLIPVKAGHLLETTGSSAFTRLQIARKAASSARQRIRRS